MSQTLLRSIRSARYHVRMQQSVRYHPRHFIIIITFIMGVYFIPDAMAARNSYFYDAGETKSENLKPFPKWTGMLSRFKEQKNTPEDKCGKMKFYPCGAIQQWTSMLEPLREKGLRKQLDEVNSWANKHPYIIDQINWGIEDYWETPYELMSVNGDCEDYAIAKYYSLRALGVSEEKLRVIIVQDFNLGGIIHAILGVYDDDELLILDNQIEQVRPALKIYHYRPIYGVNEEQWWAYSPKK